MNHQFYEFWGSFFNNAAHSQKQLDDMSTWMKQGFDGLNDLTALFMRCYGLKTPQSANGHDSQAWREAISNFQQSFAQFATQWGMVSQSEHQQLLDKCAALEKQVDDQQATITQLRGLLAKEGLGHSELVEHLKDSFKGQSEQFQAIMESIGKLGKEKP